MSKNKLEEIELFAWLGEDEFGSGEIGIKQAQTPAGMIPIVSIKRGKIDKPFFKDNFGIQSTIFGKKIMLCRFKFVEVLDEIGEDHDRRN